MLIVETTVFTRQVTRLLDAYEKAEREDLTPQQVKALKRVVQEAFG